MKVSPVSIGKLHILPDSIVPHSLIVHVGNQVCHKIMLHAFFKFPVRTYLRSYIRGLR